MRSTENYEYEEVPGAKWADIREGWKYDFAQANGDGWVVEQGGIASGDDYSDIEFVLLRAWKPVEKPKPNVAFVTYADGRVGPAYKADAYYYEAKTWHFIGHEDEVNDFFGEGIVVPAEELLRLRDVVQLALAPQSAAAQAFIDKCEELGVFGNE